MSDRLASQKILVTGGGGQLGTELARATCPPGWTVEAKGRDALDLSDLSAVSAAVATERWAAVINAGAYTAVDKAESDVLSAWQINAMAPAALAMACRANAIPLVQVSTDYVFGGEKKGSWEVGDPVNPLGVYGASKLGGELAVRTSGARHAIVRTAWVVGTHGHNFVKTMLRLAAERDTVRVVSDQWGSPTGAADLAAALLSIACRLAEDPGAAQGTFHFNNCGETSWAGFAREIFRQSALRGGPSADVEPIRTDEFPTAAQRPANSLLSHAAIEDGYGIKPRPWQSALADILDELIGAPK